MERKIGEKEPRATSEKRLTEKMLQNVHKEDYVRVVEELTIHQEELHSQNEELKRVQLELEATKAKYFELYDMAPLGYLTVSPELLIKEANLAASNLLGRERKDPDRYAPFLVHSAGVARAVVSPFPKDK